MPRYFVYSLENGLTVLEAFNNQKDWLSLSEIAKITKMNLPSASRYIRTLTDLGYLHCDVDNKRYSLAPRVLSLGFTALNNMDLRKRLYPFMVELNKKYDAVINLAILQDTDILFIERIIGRSFSNLDYKTGTRLPAYCTSLGRCILAFMDPKKAEEIIERSEIKKFTTDTIIDKTKLLSGLERDRQRGYSTAHEQMALGWKNVSVPILKADKIEGAIGISYPLGFKKKPVRADAMMKDLIREEKRCPSWHQITGGKIIYFVLWIKVYYPPISQRY